MVPSIVKVKGVDIQVPPQIVEAWGGGVVDRRRRGGEITDKVSC